MGNTNLMAPGNGGDHLGSPILEFGREWALFREAIPDRPAWCVRCDEMKRIRRLEGGKEARDGGNASTGNNMNGTFDR